MKVKKADEIVALAVQLLRSMYRDARLYSKSAANLRLQRISIFDNIDVNLPTKYKETIVIVDRVLLEEMYERDLYKTTKNELKWKINDEAYNAD